MTTLYVCRDCRHASRGCLRSVDGDVLACGACGEGRIETVPPEARR